MNDSLTDLMRQSFQQMNNLREQTKRYTNALEDICAQAQAMGTDEAHIFWSIADEALSGDSPREDETFHGPCEIPLKAGERWRFSLTPDFQTFALYAPVRDGLFTLDEGQYMSRTSQT